MRENDSVVLLEMVSTGVDWRARDTYPSFSVFSRKIYSENAVSLYHVESAFVSVDFRFVFGPEVVVYNVIPLVDLFDAVFFFP